MHILLYVFDALRADHLSCYRYRRDTSPNLDALSEDGVLFENCFSTSTWTRPVAASLLTGTYPKVHGTITRYNDFTAQIPRLPEVLRNIGFITGGFVTMGNLASDFGFAKGFEKYIELFCEPEIINGRRRLDASDEGLFNISHNQVALPLAEDINDAYIPWLSERINESTFGFIWSIETHEPYRAPEAFRRFSKTPLLPGEGESSYIVQANDENKERLIDLYDDEIFYNDFYFGEIINKMKEFEVYDEALIIVLGDHGDAFYEHGVYSHGHIPYDELIHIPLIIKLPGQRFKGRRVDNLVEIIDIFPSIISVIGKDPEVALPLVQGKSLMPLLLTRPNLNKKYVFSETQTIDVHNRYLSVRGKQWKYIKIVRPVRSRKNIINTLRYILSRNILLRILFNPRHYLRNYLQSTDEMLFDLYLDPDEKNNLFRVNPEILMEYREILSNWERINDQLAMTVKRQTGDLQESEILHKHLEKLGYF